MMVIFSAPLSAGGKEPPPWNIVVLGFHNVEGFAANDWIGRGAAEAIGAKIDGVASLQPVDTLLVREVLGEQKIASANLSERQTAANLGRAFGVEHVVTGAYTCEGETIRFQMDIIHVDTERLLQSTNVDCMKSDMLGHLTQMAKTVAQSCGAKMLSDNEERMLQERANFNAEAFQQWGMGVAAKEKDKQIWWFTQAIRTDPGFAWTYRDRGFVYYGQSDYDASIADHSRWIELAPDCAEAYCSRGRDYLVRGGVNSEKGRYDRKDYELALADINRALDLAPRNPVAYCYRGEIYLFRTYHVQMLRKRDDMAPRSPDYDRAVAEFNTAISLFPNYVRAYANRASAYEIRREHTKALRDFAVAIRLAPKCADTYNNRGITYAELGDHPSAIRDFTTGIGIEPDRGQLYCNRGLSYVEIGEEDKAIADFNKAVQLSPDRGDFYNQFAWTFYHKSDYQNAWRVIREATQHGRRSAIDAELVARLQRITRLVE